MKEMPMKKALALIVLLVCVVSFAMSQNTGKPIITVLPFSTTKLSESESKLFIDFISNYVHKTEKFEVIDPTQRETILNEIQFSLSGCTTEDCQLEVGRMLSANQIIVGSVGSIGKIYILNMKIIEVETGKTLSTASEQFDSIEDLIYESEAVVFELVSYEAEAADAETAGADEPAVKEERTKPVKVKSTTPREPLVKFDKVVLNLIPAGQLPFGGDNDFYDIGAGALFSSDIYFQDFPVFLSLDAGFSFVPLDTATEVLSIVSYGGGAGYRFKVGDKGSVLTAVKGGYSYAYLSDDGGTDSVPWVFTEIAYLHRLNKNMLLLFAAGYRNFLGLYHDVPIGVGATIELGS